VTVEELRERLGPVGGLEAVFLPDLHPGKLPAFPRQLVVAAGELLLLREQLVAGGLPLLWCPDLVLRHCRASYLSAGPSPSQCFVRILRHKATDSLLMLAM
jgi:hypothetical protein